MSRLRSVYYYNGGEKDRQATFCPAGGSLLGTRDRIHSLTRASAWRLTKVLGRILSDKTFLTAAVTPTSLVIDEPRIEDEGKTHKALLDTYQKGVRPRAEVERSLGLNVAGFLTSALEHLLKANERLNQEPPSRAAYLAQLQAVLATNYVREALRVLDEQKEETCEKSWTDSERR